MYSLVIMIVCVVGSPYNISILNLFSLLLPKMRLLQNGAREAQYQTVNGKSIFENLSYLQFAKTAAVLFKWNDFL